MVDSLADLPLGADDFAFYFRGDSGVPALELGAFLQRAAAVAKQEGARLVVQSIRPGSLSVILSAAKESKLGSAVGKEFVNAPVGTTAAGLGIGGIVVGAIIYAFTAGGPEPTPLAKSGAQIIINGSVSEIHVVTAEGRTVVMTQEQAKRVLAPKDDAKHFEDVQDLLESARLGDLRGEVLVVRGILHFRPDGHPYLIAIDLDRSNVGNDVRASGRYQVTGEVLTYRGLPQSLIIESLDPL